MKDLLDEDELKPYDPWDSFYRYYIIAFLQLPVLGALAAVVAFVLYRGWEILAAVWVALPVAMSCLMLLHRKKNRLVKAGQLAYAISGLHLVYYIPLVFVIKFFDIPVGSDFLILMFAGHNLLSVAAVFMLRAVLKRKV